MRERFWEEMSVNFTSASSPTMNGKMPHIQCTAEEIGEIVLLPGDPGRVAMFEDLLEDYQIVSNYREYVVGCTVRGDGLEHGCCPERRCFLLLRSV